MTQRLSALRSLISPGRYVQGRGALAELGEYVAGLGQQPLLLTDGVVQELTEAPIRRSFVDTRIRSAYRQILYAYYSHPMLAAG